MKYFQQLTEKDKRTLCQLFPYKDMIVGFKKFPSAFNDVSKGFRPQSISETQGRKLLTNNVNSKLAAFMLESLVDTWITDVNKKLESYSDLPETEAYLRTFKTSILPDCIELYFRLTGKSVSDEYISDLLAATIVLKSEEEKYDDNLKLLTEQINETEKMKVEQQREVRAKDKEIGIKKNEIESLKQENEKLLVTVSSKQDEINDRKKLNSQLEKELDKQKHTIEKLNTDKAKYKNKLAEESEKLHRAKMDVADKEERIKELENELLKKTNVEDRLHYYQAEDGILAPLNMDEFIEYFEYNINCVGIRSSNEKMFLMDFLKDILFQGKPIICDYNIALTIAMCVSNSLCNTKQVKILPYNSQICAGDICSFLKSEERILLLDGFLGNYNEMELMPILFSAKDKIIFVTYEYERTITYIPQDILLYTYYINLSHIDELNQSITVDEDPSLVQEQWRNKEICCANKRAGRCCQEIMKELKFDTETSLYYAQKMISEEKLDQYLAFSILPYYVMSYECSPFAESKRLQLYAGENGTSKNKELLLRWYGDE